MWQLHLSCTIALQRNIWHQRKSDFQEVRLDLFAEVDLFYHLFVEETDKTYLLC